MQEDGYLINRDDADKFNLAMDDENIDFNISGIPDAMVKRSQSISVHDLIQKIESHPQKEAIQNDLEHHRPFNPFSAKSKVAIMAAGNTELCEIINVEPKLQCKACLKHWSAGITGCFFGIGALVFEKVLSCETRGPILRNRGPIQRNTVSLNRTAHE